MNWRCQRDQSGSVRLKKRDRKAKADIKYARKCVRTQQPTVCVDERTQAVKGCAEVLKPVTRTMVA